MPRILIVSKEPEKLKELNTQLNREGFASLITEDAWDVLNDVTQKGFALVLVDLNYSPDPKSTELVRNHNQLQEIKLVRQLPIIVIISQDMIQDIEAITYIDDFVVEPYKLTEMLIRIKRAIKKISNSDSKQIISCGNLLMDTAKCETYLEGRLLSLTFKEYELLKFLATNKGKVFSRDALLNEVWGYDYYGGDRTVDVHVRRLRSKIEDSKNVFIDTVRNIGYKFRENNYCLPPENNHITE